MVVIRDGRIWQAAMPGYLTARESGRGGLDLVLVRGVVVDIQHPVNDN